MKYVDKNTVLMQSIYKGDITKVYYNGSFSKMPIVGISSETGLIVVELGGKCVETTYSRKDCNDNIVPVCFHTNCCVCHNAGKSYVDFCRLNHISEDMFHAII